MSQAILEHTLDDLLAPISENSPCGICLRYDRVYDEIREALRSDQEGLPVGIWERDLKQPDWCSVSRMCEEVLARRSKDLQIVGWLSESLFRRAGVAGIALGWQLYFELLTRYWNEVHPSIEEGDIELRLSPVLWMVQNSSQWIEGVAAENDDELKDCESWIALADYTKKVEAILLEKAGNETPAFSTLYELIKRRIANANEMLDEAPGTYAELDVIPDDENRKTRGPQTRREAYKEIGRIAEYLAIVEPHSPVPEILRAVSGWHDLTFTDLINRMPEGKKSLYELMEFFRDTQSLATR